jgi:hypothetical protein
MWYGYHRSSGMNDFAAEGDRAQFIYVSPEKNLIIVRNGLEYGADWDSERWMHLFYNSASEFENTGGR